MALTRYTKTINYIASLYANEDETLLSIRTGLNEKQLGMQVTPAEGKLLYMLIKLFNAKKVLEIGTLAGYSSICMARALPDDGCLVTIEKSEENFALAQENITRARLNHKINCVNGDAREVISTLIQQGQVFDAVFIDANKSAYPDYLEASYSLLKDGGLVIADNTLLFGTVVNTDPPKNGKKMWEKMRLFNEMLADTSRFESIMVPTSEGLSIAIKKAKQS